MPARAPPTQAVRAALVLLLAVAALSSGAAAQSGSYQLMGRRLMQVAPAPPPPAKCFDCDSNCAVCTGVSLLSDGLSKRITIDVSGCKGSSLSWMCCKGAGADKDLPCTLNPGSCTASSGSSSYELSKQKCNTVTSASFTVPKDATLATVQTHDGQTAGTIDCGGADGKCCGGSGTSCKEATSGVCDWVIDLSACPDGDGGGGGPGGGGDPDECTAENADSKCAYRSGLCAHGVCASGVCIAVPKAQGTPCRAKSADPNELCDVEDVCNGESTECPDGVAPAGTECRAISGACDVVEKCGGLTKACPEDAFKASGTTCRDPAGVCDAAEKCTGLSGECPADAKLPTGTVCRKAADLCDQDETCTGSGDDCPADLKWRDKGKGFKCGRTCFFCGAESKAELTALRNTWGLGSCNMGACDGFVWLDEKHEFCTGPVGLSCPPDNSGNIRGLSNIVHARCDRTTGRFKCQTKEEGPFTAPGAYPPSDW